MLTDHVGFVHPRHRVLSDPQAFANQSPQPSQRPVTFGIFNVHGIEDWELFLLKHELTTPTKRNCDGKNLLSNNSPTYATQPMAGQDRQLNSAC